MFTKILWRFSCGNKLECVCKIVTCHSPEKTPPRWFGRLAPAGSRPERGAGANLDLLPDIAFENEMLPGTYVRGRYRRAAPQNDRPSIFDSRTIQLGSYVMSLLRKRGP